MRNKFLLVSLPAMLLVTALFLSACDRRSHTSTTSTESIATSASPAASPKTGFEADLDWVRKGQYTYIWVFSRKDGKPLDKNDGDYLRENAHQVVDWVTTDEGRKVIGGTNFDLVQGNLPIIQKRFNAEDYSAR